MYLSMYRYFTRFPTRFVHFCNSQFKKIQNGFFFLNTGELYLFFSYHEHFVKFIGPVNFPTFPFWIEIQRKKFLDVKNCLN